MTDRGTFVIIDKLRYFLKNLGTVVHILTHGKTSQSLRIFSLAVWLYVNRAVYNNFCVWFISSDFKERIILQQHKKFHLHFLILTLTFNFFISSFLRKFSEYFIICESNCTSKSCKNICPSRVYVISRQCFVNFNYILI